jgi:hypothetical protein
VACFTDWLHGTSGREVFIAKLPVNNGSYTETSKSNILLFHTHYLEYVSRNGNTFRQWRANITTSNYTHVQVRAEIETTERYTTYCNWNTKFMTCIYLSYCHSFHGFISAVTIRFTFSISTFSSPSVCIIPKFENPPENIISQKVITFIAIT